MSANEPPEMRAYRELETLVRNLGEELATFRKRALSAETQLREQGTVASDRNRGGSPEQVAELESENTVLKTRLNRSEERVRQMLDRVRFLRQQLQTQPIVGSTRS
jgi:hypothetical protein